MRPTIRAVPALVVALAAVLATPAAADFPQSASFLGTLKASGSVRVPGIKKQKLKDKSPNTLLDLRGDLGTYTFHPNGQTLIGPMVAGAKPGRFDVTQPTGQALTDLIAGTQTYFADNAGIDATVTGVEVSGTHKMSKDGAAVKSALKFTITGTATPLNLAFTAKAKVKFKGPRAAM